MDMGDSFVGLLVLGLTRPLASSRDPFPVVPTPSEFLFRRRIMITGLLLVVTLLSGFGEGEIAVSEFASGGSGDDDDANGVVGGVPDDARFEELANGARSEAGGLGVLDVGSNISSLLVVFFFGTVGQVLHYRSYPRN